MDKITVPCISKPERQQGQGNVTTFSFITHTKDHGSIPPVAGAFSGD